MWNPRKEEVDSGVAGILDRRAVVRHRQREIDREH